jgi:hypothetical protein
MFLLCGVEKLGTLLALLLYLPAVPPYENKRDQSVHNESCPDIGEDRFQGLTLDLSDFKVGCSSHIKRSFTMRTHTCTPFNLELVCYGILIK